MGTEAPTKPRAPIERTEHPHIVKSVDTLGGEPRIEATRISVRQILDMIQAGVTIEEILADFPPLSPAQIYDAVSYALDHPEEMAHHRDRHRLRTIMKEDDLLFCDHRLWRRDQLDIATLPPGTAVYTWESLPPELDE